MTAQILTLKPSTEKAPNRVNGTVPPKRVRNSERRPREHLSPHEVESLIDAARKVGRHKHARTFAELPWQMERRG